MKIAPFQFNLRPENELTLPEFKGSTFRGTFGRALRKSICVIKNNECEECILQSTCAYPYIFDTKDENGRPLLRPFVLQIPEYERVYTRDQLLPVGIVLFGKAIDYLPYFIVSFQSMGEKGIGKHRSKFIIENVHFVSADESPEEIYNHDTKMMRKQFLPFTIQDISPKPIRRITLEFLTPVQLRRDNKPTSDIDFPLFYTSLVRRYKRLQFAHGDEQIEIPPYSPDELGAVQLVHSDLHFARFRRYSNRQQREMYLMGVVGRVTFEGELGKYYPVIKAGEYFHLGKNAAFGLGQYKIVEEL